MSYQGTLLVVDDDPSGSAMLALSLRRAGYIVQSAAGGGEALRLMEAVHFDWLITDAKMSPIDGFELSVRAKKMQPDVHVLMISAIYSKNDANGYPIDKFLPKPVQIEEILKQIQDADSHERSF